MSAKVNCKSCSKQFNLNDAYSCESGGFRCSECHSSQNVFSIALTLVILIVGLPLLIISNNNGFASEATEYDNDSYGVSIVSNEGSFSFNIEETDRIIPGGSEVDTSWTHLVNEAAGKEYKYTHRDRRSRLDIDRIMSLPGALMKYNEEELEVILFDKKNKQFYLLTQGTK